MARRPAARRALPTGQTMRGPSLPRPRHGGRRRRGPSSRQQQAEFPLAGGRDPAAEARSSGPTARLRPPPRRYLRRVRALTPAIAAGRRQRRDGRDPPPMRRAEGVGADQWEAPLGGRGGGMWCGARATGPARWSPARRASPQRSPLAQGRQEGHWRLSALYGPAEAGDRGGPAPPPDLVPLEPGKCGTPGRCRTPG